MFKFWIKVGRIFTYICQHVRVTWMWFYWNTRAIELNAHTFGKRFGNITMLSTRFYIKLITKVTRGPCLLRLSDMTHSFFFMTHSFWTELTLSDVTAQSASCVWCRQTHLKLIKTPRARSPCSDWSVGFATFCCCCFNHYRTVQYPELFLGAINSVIRDNLINYFSHTKIKLIFWRSIKSAIRNLQKENPNTLQI